MSWVGWRCTRCGHEMRNNPRFCPRCAHTVYKPIHDHERPDWVVDSSTEPTSADPDYQGSWRP
jgi:predicted amidophosphoribosyltransferase